MMHFVTRIARPALLLLSVVISLLIISACSPNSDSGQANEAAAAVPPAATTSAPPTAPPPTAAPTAASAVTVTATTSTGGEGATVTTAEAISFRIDQGQSEARFSIDEVLRGAPKTVVGVTSLVTGEILVDPASPAQTKIGTITIDASDLTTDANMRNSAIRRFILQSNQPAYQFISFEPTAISGLPSTAQPGDRFSFTVAGDLKIRDVIQPVTFNVELTADSAAQISGLAATTITRSAFDLSIPNVPGVANVAEEVKLELQFVALAQ